MELGQAFNDAVNLLGDIAEVNLLPSVCNILPQVGTDVTIDKGIVRQTEATYREYNGSVDIPCRLDPSRAYRQANYEHDVATVFEYNLELPIGVDVEPTDKVIVGGKEFNIAKLTDVESYSITKSALLLGTNRYNDG